MTWTTVGNKRYFQIILKTRPRRYSPRHEWFGGMFMHKHRRVYRGAPARIMDDRQWGYGYHMKKGGDDMT